MIRIWKLYKKRRRCNQYGGVNFYTLLEAKIISISIFSLSIEFSKKQAPANNQIKFYITSIMSISDSGSDSKISEIKQRIILLVVILYYYEF